MLAAQNNDLKSLQLILEHGVDIDHMDPVSLYI